MVETILTEEPGHLFKAVALQMGMCYPVILVLRCNIPLPPTFTTIWCIMNNPLVKPIHHIYIYKHKKTKIRSQSFVKQHTKILLIRNYFYKSIYLSAQERRDRLQIRYPHHHPSSTGRPLIKIFNQMGFLNSLEPWNI